MNSFWAYLATLAFAGIPLVLFMATPGWRNRPGLSLPVAIVVVVLMVTYATWKIAGVIVLIGACGLIAWIALAYSTRKQNRPDQSK